MNDTLTALHIYYDVNLGWCLTEIADNLHIYRDFAIEHDSTNITFGVPEFPTAGGPAGRSGLPAMVATEALLRHMIPGSIIPPMSAEARPAFPDGRS